MQLYLDMDGVLMDFEGAIAAHGIVPYADGLLWLHRPRSEWPPEMVAADAAYVDVMNLPTFWPSIEPMSDAHVLWDFCKQFDPSILTAAPNKTDQRERITRQKRESIWRCFDPTMAADRIHVCLRSEKAALSHSNAVLVDDNPANCSEWIKEGGIAVLHRDAVSSIRILRELFNV